MEYKNNRQKVIIDTLANINKPDINIRVPAFLSNAQPNDMVNYNRLKAVASIYAWKADYHAKASII